MKTSLLLLCLAWGVTGVAHAEVYQWKDASGRTVYSDRPQPGTHAQRMNIRHTAPATAASAPAPAAKPADPKAASVEAANAKIREANQKVREQNCKTARANLASLQTHGRIAMPGSNGLATDAQRVDMIKRAQQDVQSWCN